MYKKKTNKPRLLTFLNNLEYRLDTLSMRIFKIKSIKWVWILLYFGYLTVNFKRKKKSYILKKGDIIFGWFLFKNFGFIYRLRKRIYKSWKIFNFLEYEPFINTFVCLYLPVKNIKTAYEKDRLVSKKFVKYTYLKSY